MTQQKLEELARTAAERQTRKLAAGSKTSFYKVSCSDISKAPARILKTA